MTEPAAGAYPVQTSFAKPERYQRVHLLLRIGVWIVLGWLSNGLLGLAYLGGPVLSAVLVSQRGGEGFHEAYGARYAKLVAFWSDFQAYFLLGTDEFPTWGGDGAARYRYQPSGSPTVGSALLRIIYVLPHVLLAWLLSIFVFLAILIAAVSVLFSESVPDAIWGFLMGVVAWQARVLTYFLSMVEEYPPFSLEKDVRSA